MTKKIDHNQPFGAILAQYMKRDRWTGADLAEKIGCTRNHIKEILSGKNDFISNSIAKELLSRNPYSIKRRNAGKIVRFCYQILLGTRLVMTVFNKGEARRIIKALNEAYHLGLMTSIITKIETQ